MVRPVTRGIVEKTVANTRAGTVNACRRARLSPSIGGQIAVLPIHEGDQVEAGDLLLEIWNDDLSAQLAVAEQEAAVAKAQAEAACQSADEAQRQALRVSCVRSPVPLPVVRAELVVDVLGLLLQSIDDFDQAAEISGYAFRQNHWKKEYACFGCPIGCGKWTEPLEDGTVIEGPEYETIYAMGPNCDIGSRETIIKLNWYCDEYGMDTISTGGVIGFVMEMFERGIITADELDGIEPVWGDAGAALALAEKIARVEGCGEWLGQGVAAIAEMYPAAKSFAMQVKGLEMPAYHPSAAKGTALAYAVSERGACHLRGAPLGELFSGSADPLIIEGKPQLFRDHQADKAAWDSACLCIFPSYGMSLKELWQLVTAATGFEYPAARDLERAGERISTLARLFNVREGFAREADTLPDRNLAQPMVGGPASGQIVELDPMLDEYYRIMGWDENGVPTTERLESLELGSI